MTDLLLWLISAEIVGLAAFPLVFRALPGLADRGFGLAIPAGVLVVGTLAWLLSQTGLLPNTTVSWWIVVLIVAGAGVLAVRRQIPELQRLITRRRHALIAGQILFLAFFTLVALLRANDPNIAHTEKPMEIMMLNAAVQAESAPPDDPWMAGEPIAYYYGGYWNLGGITTLSSIPTAKAFNLSLALIAGMSASAIFSLVYSLVSRDDTGPRRAMVAGAGSAALLLVTASLAGWWELAAHLGLGPVALYDWLSIDGLGRSDSVSAWRPEQFWWWFRASRVINTFDTSGAGQDFTIQEFPAFSFILGDLHPHVISIPFVIAGIAVAYNLYVSSDRWNWTWIRRNPYTAAAIALVVGAAGFINQADVILITALFGGVIILKAYGETGKSLLYSVAAAVVPLIALAATGALIFSPFYFGTLDGQLQSPPLAPAEFGTRPVHFLTVWGIFILITAPFVIASAGHTIKLYSTAAWRSRAAFPLAPGGLRDRFAELRYAEDDARPLPAPQQQSADPSVVRERDMRLLGSLDRGLWMTPLALAAVPYLAWAITHLAFNDSATVTDVVSRLSTAAPLGILFALLLFTVLRKSHSGDRPASLFVLLLATLATYILFGAELFFVNDLFGNRMNTVFKFYYQGWIILSVVSGYAAAHWWRSHHSLRGKPRVTSRTTAIVLGVLLIGPLWYTAAAGTSKAADYNGPMTLDGWAYLEDQASDDAAVIAWLQQQVAPGDRILEAVGGGYSEYGRLSAATGLQTVLGWPGHERQWRGPDSVYDERAADVRAIYETRVEAEARRLLDEYSVSYVVVGARERAAYTVLDAAKFDSLGEKVFESNGTAIFFVRGHDS